MRRIFILMIACLVLLSATIAAVGQTRRRSTKSSTQTRSTRSTDSATTNDDRLGAQRVAEQIKKLTAFLYLYGPVAKNLQSADEVINRNEATPALIEQTGKDKARIRQSLKDFREAMDNLEIDFRMTPTLQRYYIKLAGVATSAVTAEERASANQFDAAGKSLLDVVNRLTDVLAEIR